MIGVDAIRLLACVSLLSLAVDARAQSVPGEFNHPISGEPTPRLACVLGESAFQPDYVKSRRPALTANCNYDLGGAYLRIAKFLNKSDLKPKIEEVEMVFGLPQLTTIYSDSRTSVYEFYISGAGKWKLYINLREAYYPLDGDQPRFATGLHPRRLGRFSDSAANLSMSLYYPPQATLASTAECPEEINFETYSEAHGWVREHPVMPPTDGGKDVPQFESPHGKHFSEVPTFQDGDHCLTQLMIWTGPPQRVRDQLR